MCVTSSIRVGGGELRVNIHQAALLFPPNTKGCVWGVRAYHKYMVWHGVWCR